MNQTHEPRGDAFRVAHPVDLLLRNSDGEAVLRILEEDSPGEDLHVSLENRSDTTFSLQQPAKPEPRPSNYHIELRFRPGVLDTTRLREVQLVHKDTAEAEEASWQLSHQRNDDGTVSFFLLHEYGTDVSPGERLHLALTNIRVAASAGSRPTLVEVVVRSGPAQARRSLPGDIQRVDRIRLVNRRGRPALPLVAAWAGTDTILNDGESQNELVLDLINTGAEPIELDATGLDSASTFVVSDSVTHDLDPRRLGDAAELANMEIDVTTPGWTVTVDDEGPRPQWIMRPVEPTVLKPGDSLSMRLSNLVSDADSGPAELAIDYANIPGYWDGRCSAAIRKAPLLYYRGVDGRTRVGVYTSHPRLDLSIGLPGTGLQADVDGRLELWAGDRKALVIGGDGAVTVVDHLSVGQPDAAIAGSEDGHLRLRTAGTDRLTIDATGMVMVASVPTGLVDIALDQPTSGIKGGNDGSIGLVTRNTQRLRIDGDGPVHMGDLNAVDVLELRGSGRFLTMRTPSRPDASWSVALDSDYGSLLFRLEPSGRLASTVLELQRSGEVVITRLRIGSQMLTEDDVRALLALAGRTRPS